MRLPLSSFGPSRSVFTATIVLLLGSTLTEAIALNVSDTDSIKRAAGIVAKDLFSYYHGTEYGRSLGLLDFPPYYWWESGGFWGTMIDYWWYTGDAQYNHAITVGIQAQRGPEANFIDANQSSDNGNDDQAFWAFTAMDAAELKFPNPPKNQASWLALAQAVFNVQLTRFTNTCGGGLPWQVYSTQGGYYYKNAISNGCFFALAARLARYTDNDTYAQHAISTWDWSKQVGIIGNQSEIWDGVNTTYRCKINGIQWTYNSGVYLLGAANMWNHTKDPIWKERINKIIANLPVFFQNGVMWEQWCEDSAERICNTDQQSFKGYLSRWMAVTAQLAPWTYEKLMPLLKKSAAAAAEVCTGGDTHTQCGFRWTINGTTGHFDNELGAGEQIAALSVIGTLMTQHEQQKHLPKSHAVAPVTHVHGISKGNASAGLGDPAQLGGGAPAPVPDVPSELFDITTADRAGAWFLTVLMASLTLGGGIWALWPDGKLFYRNNRATKRSPAQSIKAMAEKVGGHVSPLVSGVKSPTKALLSTTKESAQSTAPGSVRKYAPDGVRSPTQASFRSAENGSVRSFTSADGIIPVGAGMRSERSGGGVRSPGRLSLKSQPGRRSPAQSIPQPPPSPIEAKRMSGYPTIVEEASSEPGPSNLVRSSSPISEPPSSRVSHYESVDNEPRNGYNHG